MRIGPDDILKDGQAVQIGNKRGVVLSHEIVPSSNNFGPIVCHKFKLTHKVDRTGPREKVIELEKPIIQGCNYSSVWVI